MGTMQESVPVIVVDWEFAATRSVIMVARKVEYFMTDI